MFIVVEELWYLAQVLLLGTFALLLVSAVRDFLERFLWLVMPMNDRALVTQGQSTMFALLYCLFLVFSFFAIAMIILSFN